ncbi:RmlC-like cupin domain-containing protein [Aspergillus stella-maris]|uniref:RmlC-like cupin domain-containing protein n=1 Tax=Aspergillus stella-maris TaxID=1810926 RepID=UPI003CCD8FFB
MQHSDNDAGFTVHCKDLQWHSIAPKVLIKVVKLVPETGEYTIMVRSEAGGVLPRHRHVEGSEIYILKGTGAHPQTGAFSEGDYVSESKGAVHDPLPYDQETELLMVSRGLSVFLADDGSDLYTMDVEMLQRLVEGAR